MTPVHTMSIKGQETSVVVYYLYLLVVACVVKPLSGCISSNGVTLLVMSVKYHVHAVQCVSLVTNRPRVQRLGLDSE